MGKDPTERISPDLEQLDGLREIYMSPAWKHFLTVLKTHAAFCTHKAHSHLRTGEDRRASAWLAKADSTKRIASLINERIKELEVQLKGGIQ